SLRRAVVVDPRSFEAFSILAEISYYIGAVQKALEAAAAALAIKPSDRDVATLHGLLLQLVAEDARESDLLNAVEENDAPWRGYRPPESRDRPAAPSARAQVSRNLHQISLLAGVRQAAFSREDLEVVARDGHVHDGSRPNRASTDEVARMFR